MSRILIAIPTFENIYPDTYKALWDMDKCGHECQFEFVRGYDCATARNKIVSRALDLGVDYLMMVDNDVTVPVDALANLISHGEDVVSGFYAHRNNENDSTTLTNLCKRGEINYTMQYTGGELAAYRNNGEYLIRIHGGGMGCILIKTSVFGRIAFPWFDWINYKGKGMLSEDLYFCEQLKNAHIKIYADTRVSCGHLFREIQTV